MTSTEEDRGHVEDDILTGSVTPLLTADQILAIDDRTYQVVDVPEWGGKVRIRSLTGREYDEFQKSIVIEKGKNRGIRYEGLQAKLVALCAVDADGNRLFSSDQVNALSRKNSRPIARLFAVCQSICGIDEEDVKELAGDFEESQD